MALGKHLSVTLTRPYLGDDGTDAARVVGRVTAVCSIAAGVIHVSAAGDHTNLPVMLAGFVGVAVLQIGLGALLLWRRPSRLVLAAAVSLMLASVGIWLLSRTSGLPLLRDGHMEEVGFKDAICVLFELAAIPGLLLLASGEIARLKLASPRLASQASGVVAAATCALMAPALLLEGGEHHTHEEAVALGIHGHTGAVAGAHETPRHAVGSQAHLDGGKHGANAPAHRQADGASHTSGGSHVGNLHSTTQLASLHTGSGSHAPSVVGDGRHDTREHAGRGEGDRRHRRRGHGRARHRDRDRHKGDGKHGRDNPHEGHEDSEPPDDAGPLAAVCAIAAAVTEVC